MTATLAPGDTFEARMRAAARRRLIMVVAGVGLVALLVAAVGGMVLAFLGHFSTYTTVTAVLPADQPVNPGAEVSYDQVPVGTVASSGTAHPDGRVTVTLHLKPSEIRHIPANVTVAVAPSSIFGVQAVILTPPATADGHLHAGELLAAATSGSASLQSGLTDLNNVLTGLHPAEIETTLNALSTALYGQGPSAGAAIDHLTSYLSGLIPQLPTLQGDTTALSPALVGLSAAVPNLLVAAANSATVATTLTNQSGDLSSLLSTAGGVAAQTTTLLQGTQATFHAFLVNVLPVLTDLQADPTVVPQTLANLDSLATKLFPALEAGPYIRFQADTYLSDPNDSLLAGSFLLPPTEGASEAHAAFKADMDPPTYTPADCPRYGADAGPNCGAAAPAGTTGAAPAPGTSTGTPSPPLPSVPLPSVPLPSVPLPSTPLPSLPLLAPAAEQQVAAGLLSSATGSPASEGSPAAAMLAPLLASLVPR